MNNATAYVALCSKVPCLRFSEFALRVVKDGAAYCTTSTPRGRTRRWRVDLETTQATEITR